MLHAALEDMVKNYTDSAKEGARGMLRAVRTGIRKEAISDFALLPRSDGSPSGVYPNSFDMRDGDGFWKSNRIPRVDAKFGNGMVATALKGGLIFGPPTSGADSVKVSGAE